MQIIFHPDVKIDIESSWRWYEKHAKGLGEDFIQELERAFDTIAEYPKMWLNFQGGFKRYLLQRFPFSVIYKEMDGCLYIVAVMHNHRKPGYWQNRT